MDLKQSIEPIVRYWWLILVTIVATMLLIVIFDKAQPASYDGAVTLLVKQTLPSSEEGNDYKYDGYYAVMANQTFADTIESWLESPSFVAEVYQNAGLDIPNNISTLSGRFIIDKVVSQSVSVRVLAGSKEEADIMMNSLVETVKMHIESLLVDQNGLPIFTLGNTVVIVVPHSIDYRLQFGIGALGAVCLGIFLAYFMFALSLVEKK